MTFRTEEEIAEGYRKFRGKCKEYCDALIEKDPTLTLVRGWYTDSIFGDQQHWWCKTANGKIVDPTKSQFPSNGLGVYTEFDGIIACEQCGTEVKEENAYMVEHHAYCSDRCYAKDIGFGHLF